VVHAVSDRHRLATDARTPAASVRALERWVDAIAAADVDVVHIRERDLDTRTLLAVVRRAVEATTGRSVRVLVNDRHDVAVAARAAGVHLREDSVPAARVRAIAAPGWRLGRSVHDLAGAAQSGPVDYVYFGTVFASASKPDVPSPAGVAALAALSRATPVPVIAIGGVEASNVASCLAAGAAGVAAIGWFIPSSIRHAARELASRAAALRQVLSRPPTA
jgi:thiamine-phosphate pyrophosphorylase